MVKSRSCFWGLGIGLQEYGGVGSFDMAALDLICALWLSGIFHERRTSNRQKIGLILATSQHVTSGGVAKRPHVLC